MKRSPSLKPLGAAPKSSSPRVRKSMLSNKAKGTKPELSLRRALRQNKVREFRCNIKNLPGRPDICFPEDKIAVFINGCFWHRCPYCRLNLPKKNRAFWRLKFLRNRRRDQKKLRAMKALGWRTLTIWECRLRKKKGSQVEKVVSSLER